MVLCGKNKEELKMKVNNDTQQKTIKFEEIKIGEVFEWESVFI